MKPNTKVFLFSIATSAMLIAIFTVLGWIQKPLAIHIAQIHVWTHHIDKGFTFYKSAEFVPGMGCYSVTFENGEGEELHISVEPYQFPIRVSFDSINSPV
ncbi:MAG: hypothetical protein ACOX6U_00245 [Oscillospiraceae bacterium]|jgi:hypothetical protein